MLLTPEMCRAARALLNWKTPQLASASGLSIATVRRFESGGMVRPPSVDAMLNALQDAGLEFIPAGGKSLAGGPGIRTMPMPEPEVAAAEEALELDEPGGEAFEDIWVRGESNV
jgi:transcriptional regulator with XRE-family HTH domain